MKNALYKLTNCKLTNYLLLLSSIVELLISHIPVIVELSSLSFCSAQWEEKAYLTFNYFLNKYKIKYDNWKIASSVFRKNRLMIFFDLKSDCHHVEMFESHQTFLRLSWDF